MNPPVTAIVLSGGEGRRLRPITQYIPKMMVKVGDKMMLEWVIEWLRKNNVANLVLGVAYLKEKIIDHFGDGARFGVNIKYSVHSVEGGTAEGFRLAITRHVPDETFFALNGDQITDLRLADLYDVHARSGALATIAVVHPQLPFGVVSHDEGDFCNGFLEKPIMKDVLISSGIYVFQRSILNYLPEQGDVERTTFPSLAKSRSVMLYRHDGLFLTVNSPRELEEAEQELKTNRR